MLFSPPRSQSLVWRDETEAVDSGVEAQPALEVRLLTDLSANQNIQK